MTSRPLFTRKSDFIAAVLVTGALLSGLFMPGCAGKKPKQLTAEDLVSKKVAVAEIKGPKEMTNLVEVALINEILDQGRFEIVDRTTVKSALVTYPTESDWQRLGQKVGADYVLSIRIAESSVTERQGYDKVVEEDSVLTEEQRSSDPVVGTRYVKVKSYEGHVRLNFILFNVAENAITYQGLGTAAETVNSRDEKFPGKLRLLEKLSAAAVRDFFERVPRD